MEKNDVHTSNQKSWTSLLAITAASCEAALGLYLSVGAAISDTTTMTNVALIAALLLASTGTFIGARHPCVLEGPGGGVRDKDDREEEEPARTTGGTSSEGGSGGKDDPEKPVGPG